MKLWTSKCDANQKDGDSLIQKTAPRVLNIFDLILIGVGSSLAVGSSVLIGDLIKCVAGPAVVISILIAGVTALFGGVCLAEFGIQFLNVDSAYPYGYCWGGSTKAFIFGWALILQHIAGTASVAKGVIQFTDALTDYKITDLMKNSTSTSFLDVFPYFDYFSVAIVLLITILLLFELKDNLVFKKLFTIGSIILLIAVIITGALKADVKNWEREDIHEGKSGFAPFGGFGVVKAAAIAFYGFIGFDAFYFTGSYLLALQKGHEVEKRKKNLPLAKLATILIILVIFSGIGLILTLMVPYTELNAYAAVPFAFQHVEWMDMKWVAVVATFFTFLPSLFGVVYPLPRIIQSMANDGLLFHWLGNSYRKFKTPVFAITTGGLLAALGGGIFALQNLINVTVIVALLIYTILAFNVILLRHSRKIEDNEKEFWKSLLCNNSNISLKAIIRSYFNYKEKQPTNLTKAIITGNLVLFCVCSVGLGVIFNVFYDCLAQCAPEAVLPACLLLCIMFFNFISICCQPKSQEVIPFKVPLFPFIPCLSMFLNIFLMVTFDWVTWILFLGWMILGVLPYFLWRFWKFRRGESGKTSLYQINRINAVKLNESIWKIKTDKKSFYEGAVNPVFSYDFDDNPSDEKNNPEAKNHNNETLLELKQDEIIQRAESDVEKKLEHFNRELQLNFIPEDTDQNLEDGSEKVHWECVAEIHTEEEFSPESVALEIVDNTYNFLSEESEEISKLDASEELMVSDEQSFDELDQKSSKSLQILETDNEEQHLQSDINKLEILKEKPVETRSDDNKNEQNESNDGYKNDLHSAFQENWGEVIKEKQLDSLLSEPVSDNSGPPFYDKNQQDEKLVHLIVETFYEAHQSEMISQQNNTTVGNIDSKSVKPIADEHNKIKDFKEKLNQLLKNQINNATPIGNSTLSKSVDINNSEKNNEINKDATHNIIKTLNKSQIKRELELLLAKKPPQRPSLKSSFNINLMETKKENKIEKTTEDTQTSRTLNGSENDESFVKPSSALENSIREKILSLKNVDSEPKDVCC